MTSHCDPHRISNLLSSLRRAVTVIALGALLTLGGATLPTVDAQEGGSTSTARLAELVEQIHAARDQAGQGADLLGIEALALLRDHPDPAIEAQVRLDLSWIASRAGDMDTGLEHATRARELGASLDDPSVIASADYHQALAHWYQSRAEAAIAKAERALGSQRRQEDEKAMGRTLALLGAIHRSRSEYDLAIECHFEALEIAQRLGDASGIARSHNNIGLIYWDLNEHELARDYLEKVVPSYRHLQLDRQLSSALSNLGLIHIEMKDPAGALPILEEALSLQETVGNDRGLARILSNLGFAQSKLGDLEKALEFYGRSARVRESLGDDWGLARSLGSIASIHRQQERWMESLEFYQDAAAAAERADSRDELRKILQGMAEVYTELGQHEEAVAAFQRHVSVVQELHLDEIARRVTELESKALLRSQERIVDQERSARRTAAGGAVAFFLLGILGWNLFLTKRRAHRRLEVLHTRLADHATALQEARGRIEGLEELLSICSYCKSIRDDDGEWHQLESYLHDSSGTRLSHGVCPDCFDEALKD